MLYQARDTDDHLWKIQDSAYNNTVWNVFNRCLWDSWKVTPPVPNDIEWYSTYQWKMMDQKVWLVLFSLEILSLESSFIIETEEKMFLVLKNASAWYYLIKNASVVTLKFQIPSQTLMTYGRTALIVHEKSKASGSRLGFSKKSANGMKSANLQIPCHRFVLEFRFPCNSFVRQILKDSHPQHSVTNSAIWLAVDVVMVCCNWWIFKGPVLQNLIFASVRSHVTMWISMNMFAVPNSDISYRGVWKTIAVYVG